MSAAPRSQEANDAPDAKEADHRAGLAGDAAGCPPDRSGGFHTRHRGAGGPRPDSDSGPGLAHAGPRHARARSAAHGELKSGLG